MLHELQAKDRRIFEYWGHAASYLPMSDYRYYIPRMRGFDEPHSKWEKARLEKYGHLMKPVLERIQKEGPLMSNDFIPPKDRKKGTWWDWRPTKVALELLFWRGDLMITERRNFHRVYDLTERVLPEGIDTTVPDNDELGRFLVPRALSSYGLARENEIREHIHGTDKNIIANALNDLIETGEVVPVQLDKNKNADYYALPEILKQASKLKKKKPKIYILSPFDNLIIQRDRTNTLFNFDYALECYTPPSKRKFGYFVLPILWDEQFVGRLDPKADRKKRTFIVQKLALEENFKPDDMFFSALSGGLRDLARFNNCEKIELKKTIPSKIKKIVESELKNKFYDV